MTAGGLRVASRAGWLVLIFGAAVSEARCHSGGAVNLDTAGASGIFLDRSHEPFRLPSRPPGS
jgi:hypothetical protein